MVGLDRRSVVAGLGAIGLSACKGARALALPRRSDDLIWGACGHPFQAYPGIPLETQLQLLRDLGLQYYRVGNRNNGLARLLPLAREYGISLLPVIGPGASLDKTPPEKQYELSRKKGLEVSRQYRGIFPVWELGNELEIYAIIKPCEMRDNGTQYPCDWGPAGGVGRLDYYGPRWEKVSAALKGLLDGVAEGDPEARRAIGTAGWGHIGAFDRMVDDGLDWEITVWHDYETIREDFLQRLADLGKPIWITEFNAGAGGFETDEENARLLRERIAWYRSVRVAYRVEAAFVYELLDEPYWGDHYEARMGLYRMEGSKEEGWRVGDAKPAAHAVKQAIAEVQTAAFTDPGPPPALPR